MPDQRASATEHRIPVVLVTGFLGSGKTTLMNRLLKAPAFARAGVVVNEYGTVSIDHLLVASPKARTRIIDSGCLCGHVHEEVASSLLDLHHRAQGDPAAGFDCVLIETSGLADPVPIIQIITTDHDVSTRFELRTVVTVVDAVHGAARLATHAESLKQAAVADTLVVSKIDLAEGNAIEALETRLSAINPAARRLRAAYGSVDAETVLGQPGFRITERSDAARAWLADCAYHDHVAPASADTSIRTFALEHESEITVPGLVLWLNLLAGMRGGGLLRVKGVVNVEGRPFAIQAVQTVISEPQPLDAWPDDDRRSRLVFIVRGMDADDVHRTFAVFDFDAGRAPRNAWIDPANYRCFAATMELFRRTTGRAMAGPALDRSSVPNAVRIAWPPRL